MLVAGMRSRIGSVTLSGHHSGLPAGATARPPSELSRLVTEPYRSTAVAGEVGELCKSARTREEGGPRPAGVTKDALVEKLADVYICLQKTAECSEPAIPSFLRWCGPRWPRSGLGRDRAGRFGRAVVGPPHLTALPLSSWMSARPALGDPVSVLGGAVLEVTGDDIIHWSVPPKSGTKKGRLCSRATATLEIHPE